MSRVGRIEQRMNVAVLGLWHLGPVTAACVADAGHHVVGFDPDADAVDGLSIARPPVSEPGLDDLIRRNLDAGRLRFTTSVGEAVSGADVVWICFDTPVDDDDRADVASVLRQVEAALPHLRDDAVVVSSSQLPVGSVATIERAWDAVKNTRRASFACAPENLRLGKAIAVFRQPDRVVIGVRDERARQRLAALFAPVTDRIEWMTVESAEMTKHAINAFLALSVTFINELAGICEAVGADARQVERGLKTESRIGPGAYLAPGGAVAGGTLARDLGFLRATGATVGRPTLLCDGAVASNVAHRQWPRRRLQQEIGPDLAGRRIAVWGLTYKPGTSTLRRSEAVELCRWLVAERASVSAHDPGAEPLPPDLAAVTRHADPIAAAGGAAAVVVATEWPEYRTIAPDALAAALPSGLVIDANGFLRATLGADARFRLVSVGCAA